MVDTNFEGCFLAVGEVLTMFLASGTSEAADQCQPANWCAALVIAEVKTLWRGRSEVRPWTTSRRLIVKNQPFMRRS